MPHLGLAKGETLHVRYKKLGMCRGVVQLPGARSTAGEFSDGPADVTSLVDYQANLPVHAYLPLPTPSHALLAPPFLHPQHLIDNPPAPPPPHRGFPVRNTRYGMVHRLRDLHHSLHDSDLREWGCKDALSMLLTAAPNTVWIYSDGSFGRGGHAAAKVAFPDGPVYSLCQSSLRPTSVGAEFWGVLMALRWAHREFNASPVRILIDNQQVVNTIRGFLHGKPMNNDRNASWEVALRSFLTEHTPANLDVGWIKGHAGFLENILADHYDVWVAHALCFDRSLLPVPPLGTFARHGLPMLHTLRMHQFTAALDRHDLIGIQLPDVLTFTVKRRGLLDCRSSFVLELIT